MRKNHIRIILFNIVLVILTLTVSTYAWLIYVQSQSDTALIKVVDKNFNVNASLYLGRDFDKNGELDTWTDENDQVININTKTYPEYLEGNYSLVNTTLEFNSLNYGNYLTYLLLITNNDVDNKISISSYIDFNSDIEKGAVNFSLCNIELTEYLSSEFTTLSFENLNGTTINTFLDKDYNLYELKNQLMFLQDIVVNPSSTLVIKYQVRCLNDNDMVAFHNDYEQVFHQNYYEQYFIKKLRQEYTDYSLIETALMTTPFDKNNLNTLIDSALTTDLSSDLQYYLNSLKNINSESVVLQKTEISNNINDFLEGEMASIKISTINIIVDYGIQ